MNPVVLIRKRKRSRLDEILRDLRRAVLAAADKAKAKIAIGEIERALLERDGRRILSPEIWGEIEVSLGREYTAAIRRVLDGAARSEMKRMGLALRFNLDNPYSLLYVQARAGRMVTAVLAETKAAIRAAVERSFIEGIGPHELARTIRSSIGLTPRLTQAVTSQHERLLAGGMPPEKAAEAADRYAARLLNYRAENIARTETLDAMNQGTEDAWKTAQQAGLLDPMAMRKMWIGTPGSRTCPICSELNGQTVALNDSFRSSTLGAVPRPPAHQMCRCTTGLVEAGQERAA